MPTYEHLCTKCDHEWEDVYSIKADPPTACPECKTEGSAKRLVSGGSGRGIVKLSGHEQTAHIRSEARKFRSKVAKDENLRANMIGEDNYHQSQLQISSLENELVKIGENASKTTKSGSMPKTSPKAPTKTKPRKRPKNSKIKRIG